MRVHRSVGLLDTFRSGLSEIAEPVSEAMCGLHQVAGPKTDQTGSCSHGR